MAVPAYGMGGRMIRLSNQFEFRRQYRAESSAAGGSTSSTSSCCLVTFTVTAVVTSMHFYTLKEVVPSAALGGSASEGKTTLSGGPSAAIGFLLPLLSLVVAAFAGVVSDNMFVATCGALVFWAGIWVAAYGYAERSRWRGLVVALIAFGAIMAASAVEFPLWHPN